MTIYIDVVFLENVIMNYIIIFSTGIVIKTKLVHGRFILGSIIGAIYTVIAYMSGLQIYSNIILKFILSIIIVYVSYNPQTVKKMWKYTLIFYLTSFVFGGVAFSLIYILKPQEILMKNGLFLGTYPLKTVFISAILGFILLITAFKIIRNKITKKSIYVPVKMKIEEETIETTAIVDTGNFLKEPITNTPVMVVEHTLLYNVIPKEILHNLNEIIGGDFKKIPEKIQEKYISKLKLIPFSSLGNQHGILLGIKPKYIEIKKEEKTIKIENIIIGIYDRSFTKHGEYRALIGIDLLDKQELI